MIRISEKVSGWLTSAVLLAAALMAWACTEQNSTEEPFALYYSGVTEISPSTNLSLTPTWKGDTPQHFSITSIKFDGISYQTDCFSVDSESGRFSISGTDNLPTGTYSIGIRCESAGVTYDFPDAITIEMMKPVPAGITVTPSEITVKASDIMSTKADSPLPTAQISTDSDHVSIKGYSIANVYLDGELAPQCKEWFAMSNTGEVSIVPDNAAIIPGVYAFDFKLNTYIAGSTSEMGIYRNALTIDVTSAPSSLSYPSMTTKVEKGYGNTSGAPEVTGSKEGLTYSIKSVSPDNAVGITINSATGELTFPETDKVNIGDTYTVSVTVENKYGAMDIDNAFTFSVIDFIFPVTVLRYKDIKEVISGVSISHEVSEVDGDDVAFSFVDLPSGLSGLSIDKTTGLVSCSKGTELTPGQYEVTVKAGNVKGDLTTTFKISVLENPYKFSIVRWGNNLGLEPADKYGNQWRIKSGSLDIPVLSSDIPSDAPVSYSISVKTSGSTFPHGMTIDSKSGEIHVDYTTSGARTHYAVITVKVGGSSEAAVTHTFPFFLDQWGRNDAGFNVEYTPFAFRVNPKTGGSSAVPTVTLSSGTFSGFTLDFRRQLWYYNLHGPAEHLDGRLDQAGKDCFLYAPAAKYFAARNVAVNTGSADPFNYWSNATRGSQVAFGFTACYVDPTTLQMVVNPEKFSDDYGYADGVMFGEMLCNVNNNSPLSQNSNYRLFPIIIWFDPDYTE